MSEELGLDAIKRSLAVNGDAGWSADVVRALVEEVEDLRAEVAENEERRLQLLDDAGGLENEITRLRGLVVSMVENVVDAATAREAGITFSAVSDIANDYIRGNGTFSYLVERLRELALNSAEKIASQRHDDHIMDVQHAFQEGGEEERRKVAAWLRERANAEHPIERGVPSLSPAGRGLLLLHADLIERGEHRREETP